MPYVKAPFNYTSADPNQIVIDLDNANNNFTILANAFKDNSPDTGIVKISEKANSVGGFTPSQTPQANQIPVLDANANLILPNTSLIQTTTHTFRRVDLTNATADYQLAVGEEAIINFTNATSVKLNIATQDGTVYELHLTPSTTGGTSGGSGVIYLNPNNTTYLSAFYYADYYINSGATASVTYTSYSSFRIGSAISSIYCVITNRTVYKNVKGYYDIYGVSNAYPSLTIFSTDWRNTTTVWTSLGTVVFGQSTSGQILVRRIV
jgi:hypothetical protein